LGLILQHRIPTTRIDWQWSSVFRIIERDLSTAPPTEQPPLLQIGRYTLLHELAAGGMGTVHLAKFHGEAGFSRMLAVKRLHPHYAKDPDFLCMFLDEARIASRIRHPHVVSVVDVVSHSGELLLAMEYVQGLALSKVLRLLHPSGVPPRIAVAIAGGMMQGLHAAHEAKTDKGEFLGLVHRDVSPQNVMVGADGAARVVDFGIATAAARLQTTAEGQVKGKLSYMSPEQVGGRPVDRRADIFSGGVVLWEMLTGQRFCEGDVPEKVRYITEGKYKRPSELRPELPFALDAVVMKALSRLPSDRYTTAEEMTDALYAARRPAHPHEVRAWLRETAGPLLDDLASTAEAAEALFLSPPAAPSHPSAPSAIEFQNTPADLRLYRAPAPEVPESPKETPHKRRLLLLLVLLLTFALAVGGATLVYLQGVDSNEEDTATQPEPVASPDKAPEKQEQSGSPSAIDGVLPTAASTPEQDPKEEPSASPSPKTGPTPRISPRPRKDPCSPPYVLLKGGLKRYKPECL
jgi:serine/threonine protein kinase